MNNKVIKPRDVSEEIDALFNHTSVIKLQGARQVGKSTIAKNVCEKYGGFYTTLDDDITFKYAKQNPKDFVSQADGGLLVIDEVQLLPQLMGNIKLIVDEISDDSKFIVTSSVSLLGLDKTRDSLAGRIFNIDVFPFSVPEKIHAQNNLPVLLEDPIRPETSKTPRKDYISLILKGGYPVFNEINHNKASLAWAESYIQLLSQHEAVLVKENVDQNKFVQLFRGLCALTTKELNKEQGSKFGLSRYLFEEYLNIYKRLFLLHEIPAWHNNLLKKAVSKSKICINDSGLALAINKITEDTINNKHYNCLGAATETFVINEIKKQISYTDLPYHLYHFRDSDKHEIDLILEDNFGSIIAIEIKSKSTFNTSDIKHLKWLQGKIGNQFKRGIVFYTGEQQFEAVPGIYIVPIDQM
ncbi:MAG: DUF4143 domain-containing protein [Micrococcaceae bacterium]